MEKNIGERIKELRQKAGLTQAELAEKVGFTSQTVSNWEAGSREPDIAALAKLAQLFNVTLDYLLLGKVDDERITLDDMDKDKRLSWIIKKDDVKNFKKYGYANSAYVFGRTENMNNHFHHGLSYSVEMTNINLATWKEIIANKALKIFDLCLDDFMKKNGKDGYWATFTVVDILDDFVKTVVDLDRVDVLKILGAQYFTLNGCSENRNNGGKLVLLGASDLVNDMQAYFIQEDTFNYIFNREKESHRCYELMTEMKLTGVTADMIQFRRADKEVDVVSYLHHYLMKYAFENKKYDLLKKYFELQHKCLDGLASLAKAARESNEYRRYDVKGTYVFDPQTYGGEHRILARSFIMDSEIINGLILDGQRELGQAMIEHNKAIREYYSSFFRSGLRSASIYVPTDKEIDRMVKIKSGTLSEEEMQLIHVVKDFVFLPRNLVDIQDLKLVRKVLDNYYLNYYEFVYESIKKNDVKELYEFLFDHGYNGLVDLLLKGPSQHEALLYESFLKFYHQNTFENDLINKNVLTRQTLVFEGLKEYELENESKKLEDNRIIAAIKAEKEKIYKQAEDNLAAYKKKKAEEAERAKIVKGLTREYFEGLLEKEEEELFIIKLCSLLDAYLRFDYHFDGEDFSARLNQYFAMLETNLPKSRDIDDGWGYMVKDEKYEDEVVRPAREKHKHMKDLFYRMRIQRNNIAHSEHKPVDELMLGELEECLDFVLPKGGK